MKKDFVKRALCLVCCLTLTLGAFAYRPPEAKAVFASPAVALGASLLASVVVGTTATFFVESGAADTIGMAIDGLVREFVSSTADLAEYTSDMFFEEIPNGLVLLQDGTIQLSAAAGNLTARFINWLQDEKGIEAGGDAVNVVSGDGFFDVNGNYISFALVDRTSVLSLGSYWYFISLTDTDTVCKKLVSFAFERGNFELEGVYDGRYRLLLHPPRSGSSPFYSNLDSDFMPVAVMPALNGSYMDWVVLYSDGSLKVLNTRGATDWMYTYLMSSNDPVHIDASVQPKTEFQAIPNELPENSYLTVNPGIQVFDLSNPQAAADDIMDAIYAGTLNPSIAVGQEATDIPGTDTDEDDVIAVPDADADLLDWTKYIGQKVAAVPQAIAKAVAGVFAPDAALVNEITGAFSAKFGFVETLKQVGYDLFGMNASSEPPVVWIHLEDAEGRYNYGGTVKALDMSWYQRYKADVDRIFGGFLWIAYLWLLFKRLPDIISGAGMAAADNMYVGEFEMVSGQKFTARRSKRL